MAKRQLSRNSSRSVYSYAVRFRRTAELGYLIMKAVLEMKEHNSAPEQKYIIQVVNAHTDNKWTERRIKNALDNLVYKGYLSYKKVMNPREGTVEVFYYPTKKTKEVCNRLKRFLNLLALVQHAMQVLPTETLWIRGNLAYLSQDKNTFKRYHWDYTHYKPVKTEPKEVLI